MSTWMRPNSAYGFSHLLRGRESRVSDCWKRDERNRERGTHAVCSKEATPRSSRTSLTPHHVALPRPSRSVRPTSPPRKKSVTAADKAALTLLRFFHHAARRGYGNGEYSGESLASCAKLYRRDFSSNPVDDAGDRLECGERSCSMPAAMLCRARYCATPMSSEACRRTRGFLDVEKALTSTRLRRNSDELGLTEGGACVDDAEDDEEEAGGEGARDELRWWTSRLALLDGALAELTPTATEGRLSSG